MRVNLKPMPTNLGKPWRQYKPVAGYNDEPEDPLSHFFAPDEIRGKYRLEPLVVVLAARRGEGKSQSLTWLGEFLKQSWMANGVKAHVVSNYANKLADSTDPYIIDELISFPEDARDLVVLVDEIGAYFNRRLSLRRSHVDFSTFLQQIRKRNIEMIFTTQQPGILDDQVLQQVDLWVDVHRLNNGKAIRLDIWDWWGQFTGRWTRPRIPPEGEPTKSVTLWNADAVFPYYDTNEVVFPMWSRRREEAIENMMNSQGEHAWPELQPSDDPEPVRVVAREPSNLEEYVASLGATFNVGHAFTKAKQFDSSLRSRKEFVARLESLGRWDIVQDGPAQITAVLKG